MSRRRGIRVALIAGALLALATASLAAVAVIRSRAAAPAAAVAFGPRAVPVDPHASPAPLGPVSRVPDSRLVTHPGDPARTADGLDPDAQRVVDVTSLQLSLERYRLAWGAYPDALAALFPDFAPVEGGRTLAAPPADPVTRQPYAYRLIPPAGYEITAVMSTGRPWQGVRR